MGRNRQIENLGKEAEDVVEKAVQELITADLALPEIQRRFVGYLRSRCSDIMDSHGIDILVFLSNGAGIPIQIKSNKKRKRRAFNRFHGMHPYVKFVIFIRPRPLKYPESPGYKRTLDYIKRRVMNYADRCTRLPSHPSPNTEGLTNPSE